MDETTQRRLLGAAILFVIVYLIASLLPDRPDTADLSASAPLEAQSTDAPKVVVYDLNTPEQKPAKSSSTENPPAVPPVPKPVAPVLTLEAPEKPAGTSLGWYVQVGVYASQSSAHAALSRITQAGFSGTVQTMLKDKKKLFRTRIGPFASNAEALQAQQAAIEQGFGDASRVEIWKP